MYAGSRILTSRKWRTVMLLALLLLYSSFSSVSAQVAGGSAKATGADSSLTPTATGYLLAPMAWLISIFSYLLMFFIILNPCVYAGSSGSCSYPFPLAGASGLQKMPQETTIKLFNIIFLKMFIPWFVLIFILVGIYLIFMQGSPSGRAEAKALFINMLVGMLLVSFSPMIFQTLLDISQAFSWKIFSTQAAVYGSLSTWFTGGAWGACMGCCFLVCLLPIITSAILIALMRYLIVMICAILWPLGLFLYSFSYTKGLGNVIIKFSFLAIFSQILQTFFLAIALALVSGTSTGLGAFGNMFVMAGALMGIVISPLLMLKLMGWIGSVMWVYSTRGGGAFTRFLGSMAMGYPVGDALVVASSRYHIRQMGGPHGPMGGRLPIWMTGFNRYDETGSVPIVGENPTIQPSQAARQPKGAFWALTPSLPAGSSLRGLRRSQPADAGARAGAGIGGVTPMEAVPQQPEAPGQIGAVTRWTRTRPGARTTVKAAPPQAPSGSETTEGRKTGAAETVDARVPGGVKAGAAGRTRRAAGSTPVAGIGAEKAGGASGSSGGGGSSPFGGSTEGEYRAQLAAARKAKKDYVSAVRKGEEGKTDAVRRQTKTPAVPAGSRKPKPRPQQQHAAPPASEPKPAKTVKGVLDTVASRARTQERRAHGAIDPKISRGSARMGSSAVKSKTDGGGIITPPAAGVSETPVDPTKPAPPEKKPKTKKTTKPKKTRAGKKTASKNRSKK